MAVLNAEFDFRIADQDVRKAFLGGYAEKRMLIAGTKLYKHTSYGLIGPDGKITPWWSSTAPIAADDPGQEGSQARAGNIGASDQEFARARGAVTRQWNAMERVLHAILVQPVYGFAGRCSGQLLDNGMPNVVLIGGAFQLWIPNLTSSQIVQI